MGRIYSERSRDRAERPGVRVKRKKPSVGLIPNQPPDSQPASWESGGDDHDTSGAAKKLKSSDFAAQVDASFGYRILNFPTVFSAISESVKCKACNGEVDFTEINIAGLGFQLVISCNKCEPRKVAACPEIGQAYDLNQRMVFAFRSLGIDLSGIEKFCAIMGLPKPTFEHSYDTVVEDIQQATEAVGGFEPKNIAEEEDASNGANGSPASRCHANHAGSTGKVEVSGTAEIFPKSEESLGVECANYIGDGDSETSRGLEFDSGSSTCGSLRSSGAASSSLNGTSKSRSPACKVMEDAPSAFGISATASPSSTSSIGETSPRPDELHDRLGLPDDCQLEFVNGGHGIKNPFAVQYRRNPNLSRNEPWPPQPPPVKDNDPNPYTCRVCSKSFSGIVRLNRHMKRHSDIKRFLCTHCGNGFYDAYDLKRHTRTHTGVRPYKCNLCDRSFTQRGTLEAHCRKLHSVKHQYGHNEKRPKVYVCEECAHTTEDADVHDLHVKDKHPKYW